MKPLKKKKKQKRAPTKNEIEVIAMEFEDYLATYEMPSFPTLKHLNLIGDWCKENDVTQTIGVMLRLSAVYTKEVINPMLREMKDAF